MRALLLPLGDDLYAVDIVRAREVVLLPEMTALPSAPSSLLGVFNLRGEIVPVFDTPRLLGLDVVDEFTHVVIVDTDDGPAGLVTTTVGMSVDLEEDAEPADGPGSVGRHQLGDRIVVLLDPDRLVSSTVDVE